MSRSFSWPSSILELGGLFSIWISCLARIVRYQLTVGIHHIAGLRVVAPARVVSRKPVA